MARELDTPFGSPFGREQALVAYLKRQSQTRGSQDDRHFVLLKQLLVCFQACADLAAENINKDTLAITTVVQLRSLSF